MVIVNLVYGLTLPLLSLALDAQGVSKTVIGLSIVAQACAGVLKLNQSTADAEVDVPFGGWKWSGLGPPEHGDSDLEFFTRSQTVYGDLIRQDPR